LYLTSVNTINIYNNVLLRNIVAVYFKTFIRSKNKSLEAIIEFTKRRESQEVLSLNKLVIEGRSRISILNINRSIIVEINIHEVI
jgi:hypothetical protein